MLGSVNLSLVCNCQRSQAISVLPDFSNIRVQHLVIPASLLRFQPLVFIAVLVCGFVLLKECRVSCNVHVVIYARASCCKAEVFQLPVCLCVVCECY